jgi:protein-S-isoprenylcysteine O-methyltransferase Ste14
MVDYDYSRERSMRSDVPDRPGIIAPPPAILGTGLVAGWILHRLSPRFIARGSKAAGVRAAGALTIALGLLMSAAVMRQFRRAGTTVMPWRPATALVTSGPYRLSRNPDYVGQALVYVGVALVADSIWPLIFFPPLALVLRRGVIEREERYLERRFGEEYTRYKRSVRRWI